MVATELAAALFVFGCAVLGLTRSALWIAVGYAGHGAWDWLHHINVVDTKVARWFPPACAAFDLIIAGFILLAASR